MSAFDRSQAAAQLAVGVLLLSWLSFTDWLRFPLACAAPMLYAVISLLAPPSCDIGSKLTTGLFVAGPQILGIAAAGVVGTVARLAPTPAASVAVQCMGACLLLAILAINRASNDTLVSFQALLTAIYLGQPLLMGVTVPGLANYWLKVVLPWVGVGTAALCTSILVALLVMPSLASERVECCVSDVVLSLGHVLSSSGSQLLAPPGTSGMHPDLAEAVELLQHSMKATHVKVTETLFEEEPLHHDALLQWWRHHSRPPAARQPEAARLLQRQHQQRQQQQHVVLDLWPWGAPGGAAAELHAAAEEGCEAAVNQSLLGKSAHAQAAGQAGERRFDGPAVPKLTALSVQLRTVQRLLQAGLAEPRCLRGSRGAFDASWASVLSTTQLLVTRLSALELSITHANSLQWMHRTQLPSGLQLLQLFSHTYALAAAAVAGIGSSLAPQDLPRKQHTTHQQAQQIAAHSTGPCASGTAGAVGELQQLKQELWGAIQAVHSEAWQRVLAASPDDPHVLVPAYRVNSVYVAYVLTCSVIDTVAQLSTASQQALKARHPTSHPTWQQQQQGDSVCTPQLVRGNSSALKVKQQQHQHQQHAARPSGKQPAAGAKGLAQPLLEPGQEEEEDLADHSKAAAANGAVEGTAGGHACASPQPIAGAAASGGGGSKRPLLNWWLAYLLCIAQYKQLRTAWGTAALTSGQDLLRSRTFQTGLKFFLVTSTVIISLLVAIHVWPWLAAAGVSYGYSAAASGITRRVESTTSQVVVRTCSTVAGGLVGYAVMAQPWLAGSPLLLCGVLLLATLLLGSLNQHQHRSLIIYSLMVLVSLITCQFNVGSTGSYQVLVGKLGAVLFGAGIAAVVGHCLLPWQTSAWALETLSKTCIAAAAAMEELYTAMYNDCKQAWEQQRGQQQEQQEQAAITIQDTSEAAAGALQASTTGDSSVAATPAGLQEQLVAPLVLVRASLATESTVWKSGPLATPQLVQDILWAVTQLSESLLCWQTGMQYLMADHLFGGAPAAASALQECRAQVYELWLRPAHSLQLELLGAAKAVASATAKVLQAGPDNCAELREQLNKLAACRLALVETRRSVRQAWYVEAQRSGPAGDQGHGPYRALMHSLLAVHSSWVLDGVALVARCALGAD